MLPRGVVRGTEEVLPRGVAVAGGLEEVLLGRGCWRNRGMCCCRGLLEEQCCGGVLEEQRNVLLWGFAGGTLLRGFAGGTEEVFLQGVAGEPEEVVL